MRFAHQRGHRYGLVLTLAILLPLVLAPAVFAAEEKEPDLALGKQLNRQCALCHGLHSQGILGANIRASRACRSTIKSRP